MALRGKATCNFDQYKEVKMVSVLENVKDREQASSTDEQIYSVDEEVEEEESSAIEAMYPVSKLQLGDDLLDLYFAEVGRNALLSDEETRILARQIEDGHHLARAEKQRR